MFLIATVDKGEYSVDYDPRLAIRCGDHYYVKTFYESTGTAIVEGENGQDFRLLKNEYTTEDRQREAYKAEKIKQILEDAAKAKAAQTAS